MENIVTVLKVESAGVVADVPVINGRFLYRITRLTRAQRLMPAAERISLQIPGNHKTQESQKQDVSLLSRDEFLPVSLPSSSSCFAWVVFRLAFISGS